jgi:hypothetical protein
LIIQTDDSQWNYEVLGVYPDASVDPSKIHSKTNSGLRRK